MMAFVVVVYHVHVVDCVVVDIGIVVCIAVGFKQIHLIHRKHDRYHRYS